MQLWNSEVSLWSNHFSALNNKWSHWRPSHLMIQGLQWPGKLREKAGEKTKAGWFCFQMFSSGTFWGHLRRQSVICVKLPELAVGSFWWFNDDIWFQLLGFEKVLPTRLCSRSTFLFRNLSITNKMWLEGRMLKAKKSRAFLYLLWLRKIFKCALIGISWTLHRGSLDALIFYLECCSTTECKCHSLQHSTDKQDLLE